MIMLTKSSDNIVNLDQKETIERFASNFSGRDIASAIKHVEAAFLQIRKNVQPQLIYINLFLKLREVFLAE
jgi:hypothetical protein